MSFGRDMANAIGNEIIRPIIYGVILGAGLGMITAIVLFGGVILGWWP